MKKHLKLKCHIANNRHDEPTVSFTNSREESATLIPIIYGHDQEMRRANAELIAEAFNVTNETGKTPQELADSNKKLLAALNRIKILYMTSPTNEYLHPYKEAWKEVESAIKNNQ